MLFERKKKKKMFLVGRQIVKGLLGIYISISITSLYYFMNIKTRKTFEAYFQWVLSVLVTHTILEESKS